MSGEWFPGLGAIPTWQTSDAWGTAVDVTGAATYACVWRFVGRAETLGSGAGTWSGTCGPYTFTGCTYARSGTSLTTACGTSWSGSFTYVPSTARLSAYSFSGPLTGA
jgi:hypothetical protein